MRGEVSPDTIVAGLSVLRAEGYEVLSLSGGEPLLYSGLEEVVREAARLGYRVNLVTNGAPLGGKLLDFLGEYVDLVAVSLDGAPETHNWLRANPRAFSWAERAADRLSAAAVRFGFSYCVSAESLRDMPWAAEFAAAKSAALLQFHPFGLAGRGQALFSRLGLSRADAARVFLTAKLLAEREGPAIQVDLLSADAALASRSDYRLLTEDGLREVPLADLVNPLVVTETGFVLPFSYGIRPGLALGHLGQDLNTDIATFKAANGRDLRALLEVAFAQLGERGGFVDWFGHLVETSHRLDIGSYGPEKLYRPVSEPSAARRA